MKILTKQFTVEKLHRALIDRPSEDVILASNPNIRSQSIIPKETHLCNLKSAPKEKRSLEELFDRHRYLKSRKAMSGTQKPKPSSSLSTNHNTSFTVIERLLLASGGSSVTVSSQLLLHL